jgi:hypothetical protein
LRFTFSGESVSLCGTEHFVFVGIGQRLGWMASLTALAHAGGSVHGSLRWGRNGLISSKYRLESVRRLNYSCKLLNRRGVRVPPVSSSLEDKKAVQDDIVENVPIRFSREAFVSDRKSTSLPVLEYAFILTLSSKSTQSFAEFQNQRVVGRRTEIEEEEV